MAGRAGVRRTTAERGLGAEHQRARARLLTLLKASGSRPCRRCGHAMYHPSGCPYGRCQLCTLDLGHPEHAPRCFGGDGQGSDLEHRRCNRSAGARLGNRMRARRVTSRTW